MFRLSLRRWLAGWLVMATLFAQLATAAYACPAAAAESAVLPCGMSMADGTTMSPIDPDQPGLCVQHCQAPSQALDQGHSPSVPPPAAVAALTVALVPEAVAEGVAWTSRALRRDAIPPPAHSILHCCFRI